MGSNELSNGSNSFYLHLSAETSYDQYVFFAVCSTLVGLPGNILLLVILIRISPFSRRFTGTIRPMPTSTTGSFERFLFEVVLIDTLLIIYHFVDNFLSYIHDDRPAGQHYLIHISDFCCKFFTYIAKMSVLLATWLLLFLIINQIIHTMEHKKNNPNPNRSSSSCWNRGLHFVNAKYSTVFLIFIFSVTNIYPIEVLKYQKKTEFKHHQDYQSSGDNPACSTNLEGRSVLLLNVTNYVYNVVGVAIPCLIMFILSFLLIYRACRMKYINKNSNHHNGTDFHYIAATIGILHALFNLPGRLSDILMLFLSPYSRFYSFLFTFTYEVKSFLFLSYAYKCFVCLFLCKRFRLHAKSILCFLIENKYDEHQHHHHQQQLAVIQNNWNRTLVSHGKNMKNPRRHHRYDHHQHKREHSQLIEPVVPPMPLSSTNRNDWHSTSAASSWIRPYFTRNNRRHLLRPCGRSASCHQLSETSLSFSSFSP